MQTHHTQVPIGLKKWLHEEILPFELNGKSQRGQRKRETHTYTRTLQLNEDSIPFLHGLIQQSAPGNPFSLSEYDEISFV